MNYTDVPAPSPDPTVPTNLSHFALYAALAIALIAGTFVLIADKPPS